jgi:hypothetical protein
MFCAPGLIFDGAECVGSRFHVLRARTSFRRYRVRRVSFSCFERPNSCSALPRASGPVFIFCAPGPVFGATEVVGSRFHLLRARTLVWRYRGRRVPFSCFARPDSFSALPRESSAFFMFCAPELVLGGVACVGSRFHVLRVRTRFRMFRGCRVPFSCFTRPDSFSEVPRASGPVFMFCEPGLVFDGTEGVGSRFYVLRSRTCFRRYRLRRVAFSCSALPDSFSAIPRV